MDSSIGRINLYILQNTDFLREVNSFFSLLTNMAALRHSLSVRKKHFLGSVLLLFFSFLTSGCLTGPQLRFQDVESWDALAYRILEREEIPEPELTDVTYLLAMKNSEDPRHRRMAVILLAELKESGLMPLILVSLLDKDEQVRNEVFRLAMEREEDYVLLVQRSLGGRDLPLISAGLVFMRLRDKPELRDELRALFSHPEQEIRRRTALTYMVLFGKDDSLLLSALNDPDPVVRATALTSLGHSGDIGVLPQIIRGFFDREQGVRDAAQFSILPFGKEAVPPLVKTLSSAPPQVQLIILQIFEGLREPTSLNGILPLLFSPEERIRTRSRMVLLAFGPEATPVVVEALEKTGNDGKRLEYLALLEELKDPETLPVFVRYLTGVPGEQAAIAYRAIAGFGEQALPVLREQGEIGSPEQRIVSIELLLLLNDPLLLVDDDTKKLDPEKILLVVQLTDRDALESYLVSTRLNKYQIRDLLGLKKLQELAKLWVTLSGIGRGNLYFYYYLQWEDHLDRAANLNKEALALNRAYFETSEIKALDLSREKRREALTLEEQADDYAYMAGALNTGERDRGKSLVTQYRETRKEILALVKGLGPELKVSGVKLVESQGILLDVLAERAWLSSQKDF